MGYDINLCEIIEDADTKHDLNQDISDTDFMLITPDDSSYESTKEYLSKFGVKPVERMFKKARIEGVEGEHFMHDLLFSYEDHLPVEQMTTREVMVPCFLFEQAGGDYGTYRADTISWQDDKGCKLSAIMIDDLGGRESDSERSKARFKELLDEMHELKEDGVKLVLMAI
ncbi:hypothetical protein DZF79_04135 [Vibrio parahaemolyticus]|nr:hypothetical protein [Vibrio parahaemolyticus]